MSEKLTVVHHIPIVERTRIATMSRVYGQVLSALRAQGAELDSIRLIEEESCELRLIDEDGELTQAVPCKRLTFGGRLVKTA